MSLTNEPDKLVNTALDTLAQVLKIECCWIQTISDRKAKKLLLAAERGFSPETHQEIASMNLGHGFSEQIIGLGHKIVIPDLNSDGAYGLSSFGTAGFKWLVAVPLMTYRVYGILGTASRNQRLLQKETAELIMVMAGLIAGALGKAQLSRSFTANNKAVLARSQEPAEAVQTAGIKAGEASESIPGQNRPKPVNSAFYAHTRKMDSFRKTHG